MSQENSYNPTSLAYASIYKKLKNFADNPLVKQFSLKSFNEILAAEHSFAKKLNTQEVKTEEGKNKARLYASVLETLEMLQIQSINFTADLMFDSEDSTSVLNVTDAEIVDEQPTVEQKVESTLNVVHKKGEEDIVVDAETNISESPTEPIISLPDSALSDKEIKSEIHLAIKDGETQENIVDWMKELIAEKLFQEGSKIFSTLERGEFSDERYNKYVSQFYNNPAKDEDEKVTSKNIVTKIELPKEPISFNKMKGIVKQAYKDYVDDKKIKKYVDKMIDNNLIKGGNDKIADEKARFDWLVNVKQGVENSRMTAPVDVDTTSTTEPIFDAEIEANQAPVELLTACSNAENELKAGNRDKAVGIIKHYLSEYGPDAKKAFNDLDVQRLLNWIDEDVFHHRNPMDILRNIPLGLTDIIKEVEKLTKEVGMSRNDIQNLIYSKIEGVKLREMNSNDEIIRNKKEFEKWFESHCGFVFRSDKLEEELALQKQFEQDFDEVIKNAESEDYHTVTSLVKQYREGMEKHNLKLSIRSSFRVIIDKAKTLNPKLKEAWDKHMEEEKKKKESSDPVIPLPATTESKENGTSTKDDTGEGSSGSENNDASFAKKHPRIWSRTQKLKSLEGLTNFILEHPEIGSVDLFTMARELILNGQIKDAVTKLEKDKLPNSWDAQSISNWFRLGPARILESMDLFKAKNTLEFKKAINTFITKNSHFGQEELINKISELINMHVAIKHKFVGKFLRQKNWRVTLTKLYQEIVEENHTVIPTA